MQTEIKVGVFDWDRFPAQGDYYPDDIPQEWRLAFYSNEFGSACLSLTHYEQQMSALLLLLEDLPDDFQWSLYAETRNHATLVSQLLRGDSLPGCLILADEVMADASLADTLQQCAAAGVSMQSHSSLHSQNRGCHSCALLPEQEDLRQTRQWVERWVQQCGSDTAPRALNLWLPGASTTYQRLVEIKTLVEMLGF